MNAQQQRATRDKEEREKEVAKQEQEEQQQEAEEKSRTSSNASSKKDEPVVVNGSVETTTVESANDETEVRTVCHLHVYRLPILRILCCLCPVLYMYNCSSVDHIPHTTLCPIAVH